MLNVESNCYLHSSGVPKPGLEYQRISIDRSKLSEDEAFEHAIDMISSRQMGFRKAADFFQVSKWKLYKTARKRGIYAEIKKHNQANVMKIKYKNKIIIYSFPGSVKGSHKCSAFRRTRSLQTNQEETASV